MDKYLMISLLPSLALVGIMVVGSFVGVKLIKGMIASDSAKADAGK